MMINSNNISKFAMEIKKQHDNIRIECTIIP